MNSAELKSNLHQLIDGIQNKNLLESILALLTERKSSKTGALWNSLSDEQQQEVLDAYEESEDPNNLTPHSEFVRQFK